MRTRRQLLSALPALTLAGLARPTAGGSRVAAAVADFDAAHALVTEAVRCLEAPYPADLDDALERLSYAARDRLLDAGDRLVAAVRADQPAAMMLVTGEAVYVFDELHDTIRCEVQRIGLDRIARA
jgi:hypothetical protein